MYNNSYNKDLEKRRTKHKNNSIFTTIFANMGCLTVIVIIAGAIFFGFNSLNDYADKTYSSQPQDEQWYDSLNDMSIEEIVQYSDNIAQQQKQANCFVKGNKSNHLFYTPEQQEFHHLDNDLTVCFRNSKEALDYGFTAS